MGLVRARARAHRAYWGRMRLKKPAKNSGLRVRARWLRHLGPACEPGFLKQRREIGSSGRT